MNCLLILALLFVFHYGSLDSFYLQRYRQSLKTISMEYIPDGLTKKQWEELKKKEEEELKKKNLAAIGITKFQSR
jgi:hypothetical protein